MRWVVQHYAQVVLRKLLPGGGATRCPPEYAKSYIYQFENLTRALGNSDLETHKEELVRVYNAQGIPRIRKFASGNFCFAVRGGNKLIVNGPAPGRPATAPRVCTVPGSIFSGPRVPPIDRTNILSTSNCVCTWRYVPPIRIGCPS